MDDADTGTCALFAAIVREHAAACAPGWRCTLRRWYTRHIRRNWRALLSSFGARTWTT